MTSDAFAAEVLKHLNPADIRSLAADLPTGGAALYDALAAACSAPGLRVVERGELAAGANLGSGLPAPPDASPWLVAEVPGTGTPWIAKEQIRLNLMVVPLDAGDTRLTAATVLTWLRAFAAAVQGGKVYLQRGCRVVFAANQAAAQDVAERAKWQHMVMSGFEFAVRPAAQPGVALSSGGLGGESFVHVLLADRLRAEGLAPATGTDTAPSPFALAPLGFPFARLHAGADAAPLSRALLHSLSFLVCDLPYDEALAFVRPQVAATAAAMRAEPARAAAYLTAGRGRVAGLEMMVQRGPWWFTPVPEMEEYRRQGRLIDGMYWPRTALGLFLKEEDKKLRALLPAGADAKPARAVPSTPDEKRAARLFPARKVRGLIGLAGLGSRAALRRLDLDPVAPAPAWLLQLAQLCNGKKNALDLHAALTTQGHAVTLAQVVGVLRLLAKVGRVAMQPIVTEAAIVRALREVGVEKGDIVLAHTGYTAYGHIPGGPPAVIRAFQKAIGPKGTLCLPTHSSGGLGGPPFEYGRTPAGTGSIPNALMAMPGAIRTRHPTHSVTCLGPHAKELTEGVDHTIPIFGREGFWGRMHDRGGKIVMFCGNDGPNTFLHGVDNWAGADLPPILAHVIENGVRREVTVLGFPFHTDSFPFMKKAFYEAGVVKVAKLGKASVYGMKAQEVARIGVAVVSKDPTMATMPDCPCPYCAHIKRVAAQRKGG